MFNPSTDGMSRNSTSSTNCRGGLFRSLSARVMTNIIGGGGESVTAPTYKMNKTSEGMMHHHQQLQQRNDYYNSEPVTDSNGKNQIQCDENFENKCNEIPSCIEIRLESWDSKTSIATGRESMKNIQSNTKNVDDTIHMKRKRIRSIKALPSSSFLKLLQLRKYNQIIDTLNDDRIHCDDLHDWLMKDIALISSSSTSLGVIVGPLHVALQNQPPFELVDLLATKLQVLAVKLKESGCTNGIGRTNNKNSQNLGYGDGGYGGVEVDLTVPQGVVFVSPEDTVDCVGQTPLHIASGNGCDVRIIRRLLYGPSTKSHQQKQPQPSMIRDHNLRYPLHAACCNGKGSRNHTFMNNNSNMNVTNCNAGGSTSMKWSGIFYNSSPSKKKVDNMVKVIELLINARPDAVMARDRDGNRPIDLARQNKADQSIIMLLLAQARKVRRQSEIRSNPTFQRPAQQIHTAPITYATNNANNITALPTNSTLSPTIEFHTEAVSAPGETILLSTPTRSNNNTTTCTGSNCNNEYERRDQSSRGTGSYDIFSPDYNSFHNSLGRSWNLDDIRRSIVQVPEWIIFPNDVIPGDENDSVSSLGSKKEMIIPISCTGTVNAIATSAGVGVGKSYSNVSTCTPTSKTVSLSS